MWASSYLIKQVDGPVRGSPLCYKAGKCHALQHLGEEVVFHQPPLPEEGCLQGRMAR